jgi:RNA polymerase sigma-70 factor, ECF subfamily
MDGFEAINTPEFLARLLSPGPEGRKAFAELVRVTHDRFLGFIRRRLSPPEECAEVLQEVYLAVHKGLAGFEGKSKLTTWMFGMTHNKVCDRLGDKDRRHFELTESRAEVHSTEKTAEGWDRLSPWDAPLDKVAERDRALALIVRAIDAMPDNLRQAYQLRDVEGFSGEEAAGMLGTTEANVRVQLHRARRWIVDWVQERLEGKA